MTENKTKLRVNNTISEFEGFRRVCAQACHRRRLRVIDCLDKMWECYCDRRAEINLSNR